MTITETEKNVYRKLFSNKKIAPAKTYRAILVKKTPAKPQTMATQKKAIRNALEKRLLYNINASAPTLSTTEKQGKKSDISTIDKTETKGTLIRFRGIKVE